MSTTLVAFLASLSVGVWVYNKLLKSTGNNVKNALVGAIVAAVFVVIIVFTIAAKIGG